MAPFSPGRAPPRDEVPGIVACGDVRFSPVKRVAAAVGAGSMAIAFVHQYLRELDAASGSAWAFRRRGRTWCTELSASAGAPSAP